MINNIIDNLYRITATPRSAVYDKSSALSESLAGLLSCEPRYSQFPDFSDQQIKEVLLFALRFLDAPQQLSSFLYVKDFLPSLLSVFFANAIEEDSLREQFRSVLHHWLQILEHAVPTDLAILKKKPLIKNSPILYFHYVAYQTSLLPDGSCPFYATYAYKFHMVIREFKRKHPSQGYYESAVRAARYFFLYMSIDILSLPSHPSNMPQKYIKIFLENIRKKLKSEDIASLMNFYERLFKALIRRTPLKRRKKTRGGNRKGNTRSAGSDYLSSDVEEITLETDDEDDIDFMANAFLTHNPTDKVVTQKPHLGRSWLDSINCRYHHFWWDIRCLKLDELHCIYSACAAQWGSSDRNDRIILYLLILLHFGPDRGKLLTISCRPGPSTPRLEMINDRLFLVLDPPIVRTDGDYSGCLPVSKSVYLSLPAKLQRLIAPKLNRSGGLFEYATEDGKRHFLLAQDIIRFINKHINHRNGFKITLSRIQLSFPILYAGRFGMNPIHACYSSGTEVHRLYTSQLHYIYCDGHKLSQDYFRAFQHLDSRIISASHAEAAEDREQLKATKPATYELFFIDDNSQPPAIQPFTGYGSPKVPLRSGLRTIIEVLKASIADANNIVQRHNLFTCYAYLCLQFSSAMRPRHTPDEQSIDFIFDMGVVIISDKQSPLFEEERVILLPKTARDVISKLRAQFAQLRTLVASTMNSLFLSAPADKLFFFLDSAGNHVDFTLSLFQECLKKANIDYSLPDNSPRHYLKTHLHEHNISIDVSDMWSGHSHMGREALNSASSVLPAESIRKCREVVEAMLGDLGFSDIPYFDQWSKSR